MNILVGLRQRALGGCHPGHFRRLQPFAPPLHRHYAE